MRKLTKKEIKLIDNQLQQSIKDYKKMIMYMQGDAPIETLCLPKILVTTLRKNGICRIYDLFDADLTKIKGIGKARIGDLTTRLNEFLSMF